MKQRSYRITTGALVGVTAAATAVAWLVPGSTAGDVPPVLTSAGNTVQRVVCPASHESWLAQARSNAQRQQASEARLASATTDMVVAVPGDNPVTVNAETLPEYIRSGDADTAPLPEGETAGMTVGPDNDRVFSLTEVTNGGVGADPIAVTVDTGQGATQLASGWSMTTANGGVGQGLAAGRCMAPAMESWLVAGGSRASDSSTVVLANPDTAPVTVNLRILTPQGPVNPAGGRGVLVPPQTHVRLLVGGLVSAQESLAVQVQTEGGPVAAYLEDLHTDGVAPAGFDIITATAPTKRVVIPGVSKASESGATVRIVNPGDADTIVSWLALGDATASALPEATRTIPAGAVQDIAVPPEYREDPGALVLTSEQPVVAAVSVARRTGQTDVTTSNNALVDVEQPRRDTYDLMWLPAAPALPTTADEAVVVPLPNADEDVRGTLVVAAQAATETADASTGDTGNNDGADTGAEGEDVQGAARKMRGSAGFSAPLVITGTGAAAHAPGAATANGSDDGGVERIPLGGASSATTDDPADSDAGTGSSDPDTGTGADADTGSMDGDAPGEGSPTETFPAPEGDSDSEDGAVLYVAPVSADGATGEATEYRLRPGTASQFEFGELVVEDAVAVRVWATGQSVHANVLLMSSTGDAAMTVAAGVTDMTQWQVWVNEPAEGVAAATT